MLGLAGYRNSTQVAPSGIQSADKAEKAEGQQGSTSTTKADASPLNDKRQPREHEPDCSKSENADLCAQRRMAEAAEAQTRLNEMGLLLLGFTLIATGAAAFYARRAALAARQTVVVMDKTAERQLRAYVNVVEGNLVNFDTDCPVMQVVLKNFGQTPAHEVTVFQTGKIAERPLATTRLTINMQEGKRHFGVVGPGADFHLRLFLDEPVIPEGDKDVIRGGLAAIYWCAVIRYKDVFGSDWWTTFRVMYKQDVGVVDPEGSLVTCDEGNEAT